MFNMFGGGTESLRRLRRDLEESIREPDALWSYPVVREQCSCGASTETVLFDDQRAAKVFAEWRKTHGCTVRDKSETAA